MSAAEPMPRERILAAALELMTEYGYNGMSLQEVADRVGLHKSTIFHYFKGKEALGQEVFLGTSERLLKRVAPILELEPVSLDQLLEVGDVLVDHFAEERWTARFLTRFLIAQPGEAFQIPSDEVDHPLPAMLFLMGRWLDRARNTGVIRPIKVRQTLLNLMGVVLFYPAVAQEFGGILGEDPWSERATRDRKRELRSFLLGALRPLEPAARAEPRDALPE